MSLKGYLAKLGFTTAAAGSAAVLAFSAGSDLDAPNRTGWYADLTLGSESYNIVAGGESVIRASVNDVRFDKDIILEGDKNLHKGESHDGYNISMNGGSGMLRMRRESGLGGGIDFVAGQGRPALYFTSDNAAYTRRSYICGSKGSGNVWIGSGGSTNTTTAGIHIRADNTVGIQSTESATDTTSGALVVSGGAGIAGKLFVGDDLHINGKLTVTGLIDPTGLQFDAVEANPGSALTLWVDSLNDDTLMYGAMPITASTALTNSYVGFGSESDLLTGVDTFTYDPTDKTLTFHDFQWRQIDGTVARNLWLGRGGTFNTGTNNGVFIGLTIPNIPNSASNSIWLGNGGAAPVGDRSLTIGRPDLGTARNAVCVGSQGGASGLESVCLGHTATASHNNSVAIGRQATTTKANQIVLGNPSRHSEVYIPETTSATDTTSGALVVVGGVGIGGKLFIGDDLSVDGKLTVTGLIDPTGLQFDAVEANPGDALTLWVDSTNANALMFGATPVIGGDIGGSISTGRVAYGVGADTIGGNDLFTYDPTEATGRLTIGNTTISTSATSGALVVAGGAGIGGKLFVGDDLILPETSWTYYGAEDSNGSWRFGRDGDNTVFQRRESGSWVTKMTVEA